MATDDVYADNLFASYTGFITAYIGGSGSFPNDGDGNDGDVNAEDDLRAGDDVLALGTKSAVVKTATHGVRRFYSDESTEVYFFDRGHATLQEGQAYIALDPVFSESVSVSPGSPLLIQITPTARCNGIFIESSSSAGFSVRELGGGLSDASFSWEVAGRRRGYESTRLESTGEFGLVEEAFEELAIQAEDDSEETRLDENR